MDVYNNWKLFAVENQDIEKTTMRDFILESWERSRRLNVDPFFHGVVKITDEELESRKARKKEMFAAAMPYLHKLYKNIRKNKTIISLTDEDGVILECLYDEKLSTNKNFPSPGSVHSEKYCGTNGIGTSLAEKRPVQIFGAEHWLKDNHEWFCNTVPITRYNRIIGALNLSCVAEIRYEDSLGMVSAIAYAIEREMEMNVVLKERKKLVSLQKTIIELLDTGIIVVNKDGEISQNNDKARQILNRKGDWHGMSLSDIIDCNYDFIKAMDEHTVLDNFEIPVKIGRKYSYIGFSTAFIENSGITDGMVLRIREQESIRRFANIAGGSNAIYSFDDIIGKSEELDTSLKIANLASKNTTNVLITGESGTGKELIAQSIHNASSRRNNPFVALNCGALSRELIQSELFGYEGGSFTGAKKNGNPGKFELADGGTLFLDEIGEMSLDAQTNLLRVLQTGDVLRIGARYPNKVDVRVIAATNKDIEQEIVLKNFRKDLFYRLNVLQVSLPPLRERKSDIELLSRHFLKRFASKLDYEISDISPEAADALQNYNWPGNIRELENTIERAVVIAESGVIELDDLPDSIRSRSSLLSDQNTAESYSANKKINIPWSDSPKNINQIELDYIKNLLSRHGGNLRAASLEMGVARSTLYNKIKKYMLNIEAYR